MYKKNILFLLISFSALTPLYASDPKDDAETMFWGILTAVGLAHLLKPKPKPEAPKTVPSNRRQEELTRKAWQVFEKGDKNGLEGYLSYDLFKKDYRVFLPEDKSDIQNYFVQLEGFVRESVSGWEERERLAKKVRDLRDKFNQEYKDSQRKIDARLAVYDAGIVKPNEYLNAILDILNDSIYGNW